ncbi:hypothetical protein, partial [Sulfuricurvum sp.]|uniref:hypothetical protein n=1 Tax=Sulfuricurvum sp. TaxID=2025608 RepID=UPI0025F7BF1F
IVERDWLEGKLASLDLSTRKEMVDSKRVVQAATEEKNPLQESATSFLELANKKPQVYQFLSCCVLLI